ncbi:hypothetical protein VNO77_03067 [Canavalia gladiata]|uniref:Uncharacterized protein n=1 Tax=Canavalia gladiata TaxID=3824 RepID=A0AAN9R6L4_CANGL
MRPPLLIISWIKPCKVRWTGLPALAVSLSDMLLVLVIVCAEVSVFLTYLHIWFEWTYLSCTLPWLFTARGNCNRVIQRHHCLPYILLLCALLVLILYLKSGPYLSFHRYPKTNQRQAGSCHLKWATLLLPKLAPVDTFLI